MRPVSGDFVLAIIHEWRSSGGPALRQAIPLCDEGGVPFSPAEFMNNGRIFLTYGENFNTGDVIWGTVREDPVFNENSLPTASKWILNAGNIGTLETEQFCEVLDVHSLPSSEQRELAYPGFMPRPIFFLRLGSYIYGPYQHDTESSPVQPDVLEFTPYKPGLYYRIPYRELREQLGSRLITREEQEPAYANRTFIHHLHDLVPFLENPELQHCAMSSSELAEWFHNFFDPPVEIGKALRTLLEEPEIPTDGIVQERLAKLGDRVLSLQEFHDWRVEIVDRFLQENEEGQNMLRSRLNRAQAEYIKKRKSALEKEIIHQLAELAAERELLQAQVDHLQKQNLELAQQKSEREQELQRELAELEELEGFVRQNLAKSMTELKANVVEIGPVVELFFNRAQDAPVSSGKGEGQQETSAVQEELSIPLEPYPGRYYGLQATDERTYVERLHEELRNRGRHVDYHQVANIWTCVKTGYLTILAGPPGVGKSSMVTLLADIMNLEQRFKMIPVERNWSDDRDLLGYVNTLHHRYEASKSGFLEHLIRAEKDAGLNEAGFYWLLLDEMNLAPIEHYFAKFISAMAHVDLNRRVISLYQPGAMLTNYQVYPQSITIGNNVHFFGTINADFSTEPLSPRLMDRANIVWMDMEKPKGFALATGAGSVDDGTLNFKDVYANCFKQPTQDIVQWVHQKLESIYDACADSSYGRRHHISPRTYNDIVNYVANSEGLMQKEVALDFQILQRIVPRLSGYGEGSRRRLEAVAQICQDLVAERSERRVRQMLAVGDLDDNYEFFR